MAKKQRAPEREEKTAAEYYRLNTRAVDDLVSASPENSPPVSEAELRKYRSMPKVTLADWVKAVLIKIWFAGACCFFFLWGLGIYLPSQWDQMLVLGLGLGTVTDLMVNNLFRFYAKTPGANDRWMMVAKKRFLSLPLNILYAFVLLSLVVTTYHALNAGILAVTGGDRDTVPLGVEPILFGLLTAGWDLLLLRARKTVRGMLADAKKSAAGRRSQ